MHDEAATYSGGCHCGAVSFTVTTNLAQVITCNCSICTKTGSLFTFVPATAFALTTGADDLTDYQFAAKRIHHMFCKHCGIRSFAKGVDNDGNEMRGINVRCLEGVDLDSLTLTPVDGKNF